MMKVFCKNIARCTALVLICLSCSTRSQNISEISCSSGGGEIGIYVTLKITKDSVITNYRDAPKNLVFIEKIRNTYWDSLTKNITAHDLKTLKSHKSTAYIDDPDSYITIKTDEGDLSFINIEIQEIEDRKLKDFVGILQRKQSEVYAKYK